MKILFLTPWYPDENKPNHGVFVREQACALAEHHLVVVISAKVDYESFGLSSYTVKESVFRKVKEFRLTIKRSLPLYNQWNYFLVSRKVALNVIQSFQPDVIHGNIGYPGGFWSWLVSKKSRKPYVITEHTFITNNFRSLVHRWLTLFAMKKAAAVITVSKKSAKEILKYVRANVRVIPNMVDVSRFSIQPYSDGAVSIGFIGRLTREHVKGLDVLLRALSHVKGDFVLHVAGDGGFISEYKRMVEQLQLQEKVKFHGFIDYEKIPTFLNRLHFFVNTSRFETFGISIVEAMASGLPVVCFDNGGPGDFVDASNGILVENQNEEKLKEGIAWMIANYQYFDRNQIREYVLSKFSKEKFVRSAEQVYSEVIGSSV
ncbi:MAG TPA: hypothetical protein DGG95_06990 [Cytophagales bacterium]|jgi:L-malate glycosyltransferase|nr:hypothetical protein [Cytophagales bacterium]